MGSVWAMGAKVLDPGLIVRGILPGGFPRIIEFLRTFPFLAPSRIPMVISDWIIGLSMRDFAENHLTVVFREER